MVRRTLFPNPMLSNGLGCSVRPARTFVTKEEHEAVPLRREGGVMSNRVLGFGSSTSGTD